MAYPDLKTKCQISVNCIAEQRKEQSTKSNQLILFATLSMKTSLILNRKTKLEWITEFGILKLDLKLESENKEHKQNLSTGLPYYTSNPTNILLATWLDINLES